MPSSAPSVSPSEPPTSSPTELPTATPSSAPSASPSAPTEVPSSRPIFRRVAPSERPTSPPMKPLSVTPSLAPIASSGAVPPQTSTPTIRWTSRPFAIANMRPTRVPTISRYPTRIIPLTGRPVSVSMKAMSSKSSTTVPALDIMTQSAEGSDATMTH